MIVDACTACSRSGNKYHLAGHARLSIQSAGIALLPPFGLITLHRVFAGLALALVWSAHLLSSGKSYIPERCSAPRSGLYDVSKL